MKRRRIVIATIKSWNIRNAYKFARENKLKFRVYIFTKKGDLTLKRLRRISPEYIFFPHWSWIIPRQIFEEFECVIFHMTDLPFGRGGSPLQNLIQGGFSKTKISAVKVVAEIDAGPVYLKKKLFLKGSARNILEDASRIIYSEMIKNILTKKLEPMPQRGKVIYFKRRKPTESAIPKNADINRVFDHIRMLDGEGYPAAFLKYGSLRFEFYNARKNNSVIDASVRISRKG